MDISQERLMALMGDAFDCGYESSYELKKECLEELIQKNQFKESEYKVYKVAELSQLPEGTIFEHSSKGRCCIACKANKVKHMLFDSGQMIDFCSDTEPWNLPMKILYTS
jgi:hypothetical protein